MKHLFGLAVLLALGLAFTVCAADGGGGGGGGGPGGPPKRPPPGMMVKFILDHKDALNLTADQITQLEALAKNAPDHKPGDKPPGGGDGQGGQKPPKGPPPDGQGKGPPPPPPDGQGDGAGKGKGPGGPAVQILTDDQKEKLKELLKAEHPGGPGPGGGGGGNKPPKN